MEGSMGADALTIDEGLEALFASDPVAMADPWPLYARLREESPVHRAGPALLLSRWRDVRPLLRDGKRFSNSGMIRGTRAQQVYASLPSEEHREAFREVSAFEAQIMSRSDDEVHDRLRRIAHRAFTPRRIAELGERATMYTDQLLAAVEGEEVVDIVSALAFRLPLMIIADMLGVLQSDREQIKAWSDKQGRNRAGTDPDALMEAHTAIREFKAYVGEIVEHARKEPGTDLVSALIQASEGDQLSDSELTAMFVVLLFAGHETTTNLIGIGLLELLRRPQQWRLLCDDPSRIEPGVEELLRFVSPVQWTS